MRTHAVARRTRYLQLGVPAAVLGTLTGAIAIAPASADAVTPPVERLQAVPTRDVAAQATPVAYTVRPGDTITSIANRFGLRTVDVLTWNGLTWRSVIYPGQKLSLSGASAPVTPVAPPKAPSSTTHVVVAGDTIFAIAKKYATTVDKVLAANGLSRASVIYPGQKLAVSGTSAAPAASVAPASPPPVTTGGKTHAVTAGDTLFGIAQKYGTTVSKLYSLNGLAAGSIIYPGQKITVSAPTPAPASTPASAAKTPPPQLFATLDAEQAGNASLIIRIGRELGASDRAVAIALATAMVESSMRNVTWGDRDSLGLFQQRPSMGWGTPEQAIDAERSTRVFYGGASDPNGQTSRGLLDIAGWEGKRFTDAAQAVQISAYPERYGQWETQAYQWLGIHG